MKLANLQDESFSVAFESYQIPYYVLETIPECYRGMINGAVFDVSSGELGDVWLTESPRPYALQAEYHEPSYWCFDGYN